MKAKATKRQLGVSIYPSPAFLADVEKLAEKERRKRSPMLLILAEEGFAIRRKPTRKAGAK